MLNYKGLLIKDKNNVELLSYFILYFKDIVEIFNKFTNIPSEENNNNECNCEEWPNSYSDDENNENDDKSIGVEKDDDTNNDMNDDMNDDDKSIDTNISEVNIFDNCETLVQIINPPLHDNEFNEINNNNNIESHVSDENIFSNCEKLINIINPPLVDEIKKDQ